MTANPAGDRKPPVTATAATAATAPSVARAVGAATRRYREVAALIDDVDHRPVADPALCAATACRLAHEARLLDSGRFEDWLSLWATEGVLWVPIGDKPNPARDQGLFLDDRRRIGERVAWRRDPSAWGQRPPSRTCRTVSAVEAWRNDASVLARSSVIIDEHRSGRWQQFVGHQIHEYTTERNLIRTKILLFPCLEFGVRNPSFIL